MDSALMCLIDWYSFTVPLVGIPDSGEIPVLKTILDVLRQYGLGEYLDVLWTGDVEVFPSKGFYAFRAMDRTTKLSISYGGVNNHVLIDCTGETCQHLRDADLLSGLIAFTHQRASRIDLTADIITDVRPLEFVASAANQSIKSRSNIVSDTGETAYMGSWTSDRFARVYRYDGDHPRSHLLRVEHVHRGKWAKAVAELCQELSLGEVLISCSEHYGWKHPVWQPGQVIESPLRAKKHDRDGAATLKWLNKAVAPALIRAHRDGLIDAIDWLRENVVDILDNATSWGKRGKEKANAVGISTQVHDMNPMDGIDHMAVVEPQINVDHPEPRGA
jgi:DNA relaxase NicK